MASPSKDILPLAHKINISYFPVEILEIICDSLGKDYHFIISMVSRRFRDIIKNIIQHRTRMLKYEVSYGFKTPLRIISSVSLIKWACAQGYPWDWQTCAYAAESGHLEVLQWARANGCPE